MKVPVEKIAASARRSCTRRTRCSATAAAGSRSRIPRSTRCRCARSSRPRPRSCRRGRSTSQPEIMIPLVGAARSSTGCAQLVRRVADEASRRARADDPVHDRHDDRAAARVRCVAERDRRARRLLLLRHERPHADDVRPLARRRRPVPARPTSTRRSCPTIRSQSLDQDGVGELVELAVRARPRGQARASRSAICGEHGGDPALDRVLPPRRPRLRVVLAVPRADRAPRGGARRARREERGRPGRWERSSTA